MYYREKRVIEPREYAQPNKGPHMKVVTVEVIGSACTPPPRYARFRVIAVLEVPHNALQAAQQPAASRSICCFVMLFADPRRCLAQSRTTLTSRPAGGIHRQSA